MYRAARTVVFWPIVGLAVLGATRVAMFEAVPATPDQTAPILEETGIQRDGIVQVGFGAVRSWPGNRDLEAFGAGYPNWLGGWWPSTTASTSRSVTREPVSPLDAATSVGPARMARTLKRSKVWSPELECNSPEVQA